nr:unnamed protein product [Callosobruchus analis]
MSSELSDNTADTFEHSFSDFIPDSECSGSESGEANTSGHVSTDNVATTFREIRNLNKKSKRGSRNTNSWKRNERKCKRAKGEHYVNVKENQLEKRRRGGSCNCRFICWNSISEAMLNEIFESFYRIADKEQHLLSVMD